MGAAWRRRGDGAGGSGRRFVGQVRHHRRRHRGPVVRRLADGVLTRPPRAGSRYIRRWGRHERAAAPHGSARDRRVGRGGRPFQLRWERTVAQRRGHGVRHSGGVRRASPQRLRQLLGRRGERRPHAERHRCCSHSGDEGSLRRPPRRRQRRGVGGPQVWRRRREVPREAAGLRAARGDRRSSHGAVLHVVGTEAAFAALRYDGSVVTWGAQHRGGSIGDLYHDLVDEHECSNGWQPINGYEECVVAVHGNQLWKDAHVADNATVKRPGCWYGHTTSGPGGAFGSTSVGCVLAEELRPAADAPASCGYRQLLVSSQLQCEEACCADDNCNTATWWRGGGSETVCGNGSNCVLHAPQLSRAPAGWRLSYRTWMRQLCRADGGSAAAALLSGTATGLYATARSFAALVPSLPGGGLVVWPAASASADVRLLPAPAVSVSASEEAVAAVLQDGSVSVLWADGGERDERRPLPEPPVNDGHVVGISPGGRRFSVATRNGGVRVLSAQPPLLARFHKIQYSGCYWHSKNSRRDYDVIHLRHTREECARVCLDSPECTGFEYPKSGEYCAPWFRMACSSASSLGLHLEEDDKYELYIREEVVLVMNLSADVGFQAVGAAPCETGVWPDKVPAAVALAVENVTGAMCQERCETMANCTGYTLKLSWAASEGLVGERGLCQLHDAEIAAPGQMPEAGREHARCFARMLPPATAPANSTLIGGAYELPPAMCHGDCAVLPAEVNCTRTTADGDCVFGPGDPPMEVLPQRAGGRVLLVTAAGTPEADPVAWTIAFHDGREGTAVRPGELREVVTAARQEPGITVVADVPAEGFSIQPTMSRGHVWFTRLVDVGCFWPADREGIDYIVVPGPHSAAECAAVCAAMPHCTGFEHPKDGRYCAPWLHGACTNASSGPTPSQQPDFTLYTLSALAIRGAPPPQWVLADAEGVAAVASSRFESVVRLRNGSVMVLPDREGAWIGDVAGAHQLVAVRNGVAAVAAGERGYDECGWTTGGGGLRELLHPCGAAGTCGDRLTPCGSGQWCVDPARASWEAGDFVCSCMMGPGEAVGAPSEDCASEPQVWLHLAMTALTAVLPFSCLAVLRCKDKHLAYRRRRQERTALIMVYRVFCNQTELSALRSIMHSNSRLSAQVETLRVLVPGMLSRQREFLTFALWQTRLRFQEPGSAVVLASDLLDWCRQFCSGPLPLPRRAELQPAVIGLLALRVVRWFGRIRWRWWAHDRSDAEQQRRCDRCPELLLPLL
eukprot:TRINITY_DN17089_c0_g1_i3.p1 TRINITY_DN17089_c0_g1~~TRINITY_DN17089_c0_g1_i3.p1  ORF type:complete len:1444 (+),score=269.40 TRINITY_DN17089_c0_g1_i3:584-4333(+)